MPTSLIDIDEALRRQVVDDERPAERDETANATLSRLLARVS